MTTSISGRRELLRGLGYSDEDLSQIIEGDDGANDGVGADESGEGSGDDAKPERQYTLMEYVRSYFRPSIVIVRAQ